MRVKGLERIWVLCRWNTVLRCGSSGDYQERPSLSSRVHQNWQKTEPGPRGVRWASEGRARADTLIHNTTLALRQRSFVLLCRHLLLSRLIDMSYDVSNYWRGPHRWTGSFYAGRTTRGIFRFLFLTQFLYFVDIFWLISKEILLSRV